MLDARTGGGPVTLWAGSSDGELERLTIRRMVGKQEWFVVSWQALICAGSSALDDYRPGWPILLIVGATVMHVVAVPIVSRIGGAFAHGRPWILLALAWALLFPCVMLLLIEPTGSSHQLTGIPMGNYAASTLTVFAFYPWWHGNKTRRLWISEIAYVAVAAALPGAIIVIAQTGPTFTGFRSAAMIGAFNVAGYVLGRTIRVMCRVAAQQQVEVQQQNYEEFFNFLHSHVKAGIAAVRAEWGNDAAMREKLEELEQAVSDRRIEFLLAGHRVPLAALLSERIRTFAGTLQLIETPRVGALTVPRSIGVLVSRALGDLLKNAVLHGGHTVAVRAEIEHKELQLEVSDNGPGFNESILEDDNCSVARLRRAARDLGGDLIAPPVAAGAVLRLTVPLGVQQTRRE